GIGDPEQVQAGTVTANLFPMLGVEPALGRSFNEDEDRPNAERVALLSDGFWKRRFAADPNVRGQVISLNGQNATVIGVMPPEFGILPPDAQSPKNIEIWLPIATDFAAAPRGNHGLRVIARLKPGVTQDEARAEMGIIGQQMDQEFYGNQGTFGINAVPLLGHVVQTIKPTLIILLVIVGLVLLIACANVANLLLARAVSREREIAVRTALGAGRRRIIRQLLTESVLLSFVSGALGFALSLLGLKALIGLAPANVPRLEEVSVDVRVLLFTLLASILTGLAFGLAPAFQASRTDLTESLKEGGRGSSKGAHSRVIRNILVVSEVALALVVLTSAGLMIRSFLSLQRVDPGFKPENVLTARISLPTTRYADNAQVISFYQQVLERVKNLPGVESVGSVSHLPLSGSYTSGTVTVENPPADSPPANFEADRRAISSDYFGAMDIRLVNGRQFTEGDSAEAPGVAIIDETFARRFWAGEDPLGKRMKIGGNMSTAPWLTIVGVVSNVKHYGLSSQGRETVYFPYAQMVGTARQMFLTIETTGDPLSIAGSVRSAVWEVNSNQPIASIRPMEDLVYGSVATPRFSMLLLGTFAAVALILAAVGVYGVMNYSVSQRTHEIGIRMALGARSIDVVRMVVRQGLMLTAAGVAIGAGLSLALMRLMSTLLFGVTAADPATFVGVGLLLAGVAVAASFIPARKATKIDPMIALRYE
ncbi:MAG TPA: ABC transporter permease, partial [Blastocatellia bacterium]|nr:ABC transporter permease [Blastocatellia bacterium]